MTDLFKEKAKDWDANEKKTNMAAAISASILERIELDESMEVMDFGAGTGLIASRIAPHVKRISALDTSRAMLETLAAKSELNAKVDIVCQDIIDQPLDTRFDLIVSAMAMHHVEDTSRLIQRFSEHLKPSGRVALADLDTEPGDFHPAHVQGVFHFGFDREALRRLFKQHGFSDIEFTTAHVYEGETKEYPIFLLTARKS